MSVSLSKCVNAPPTHHETWPLGRLSFTFNPDINSLSQIPGAARLVGTKANISVPDHGQSLLTSPPTDHPPPHPPLNLPLHRKPAICHKVIIELSIGKQLTPFFSFSTLLLAPPNPPPCLLIWIERERKHKKWGEKAVGVTHLILLAFPSSPQINRATGKKRLFSFFLPCLACWSILKSELLRLQPNCIPAGVNECGIRAHFRKNTLILCNNNMISICCWMLDQWRLFFSYLAAFMYAFILSCLPAAAGSAGPDGHAGVQPQTLWLAGVWVRMDVMEHHLTNIWIETGEPIPILASLITHLQFLSPCVSNTYSHTLCAACRGH